MVDGSLLVFGSLVLIVFLGRVTAVLPVPCCLLPPAKALLSQKEAGGNFSVSLAVPHSRAVGPVAFFLLLLLLSCHRWLFTYLFSSCICSSFCTAVCFIIFPFPDTCFLMGGKSWSVENIDAFNSPFQLPLGINILSCSVVGMLRS